MNLFLRWLLLTLALIFTAWIVPGISVANFITAMFVVIVIALINMFIRPMVMFITLPINILTLGIFTFVINALLFMLAGYIAPGFEVEGFWSALFGSLIFSLAVVAINSMDNEKKV